MASAGVTLWGINLATVSEAARTKEAPRDPARRGQANSDQREPSPRVLNPAPSSFRGRDRNAAHKDSEKAADVTRARGAAGAKLPRSQQKPGRTLSTEAEDVHCLRCVYLSAETKSPPNKKNQSLVPAMSTTLT